MLGIHFTLEIVLLALVILLVAGVVKGVLGFGVALVSAPLLVQIFPTRLTLISLTIPFGLTNLTLLLEEGLPWDFLRRQKAFFVVLVVATIVGVIGLVALPVNFLYLAMSIYLVGFLVFQQYEEWVYRFAGKASTELFSGVTGGILGGGLGVPGPPIIVYMYLQTENHGRSVFVAGMASAFVVVQSVRIPPLIMTGLFGWRETILGLVATLAIVVGLKLGSLLRPRLPESIFQYLVKGFLLTIAGKLAYSALL